MSFVTTASRSSSPSVRQRAATRAVLPEPTGPPMPMRSARAPVVNGSCRAAPGGGWVCGTSVGPCSVGPCSTGPCSTGACECGSGCKETHLPGGVKLGADVEQGSTRGRQGVDRVGGPGRGLRRDPVAGGGERGQQTVHRVGIETQQPDGGTGRPRHGAVRRGDRRL